MRMKTNVRLYTRGVYFVLTTSVIFVSFCLLLTMFMFDSKDTYAAATGDYRTVQTGNWNATSTWETYNGTSWVAAGTTPTSANGVITIQSGHTVTVTANVTVDEVIIESSAALTVNSSKTLTIANGAGTDCNSDGTITIFGTINISSSGAMITGGLIILKNGGVNTFNSGATLTINNGGRYRREDASFTIGSGNMIVNSGGVYQHNMNGQAIPVSTFNTGSLCEVTGVTTTKPSGGLNQTFYDFTWNCPNQTSIENLTGKIEDVTNDLNFVSTGTGSIRLGEPENYNLIIGGDLNMQGGTVYASAKSQGCTIDISGDFNLSGGTFAGSDSRKDNGEASPTITINGNFNVSNGTFDANQHTAGGGKGKTDINIIGNWVQTGGTVTETSSGSGRGRFYFAKSGTQTFSNTGGTISNKINFTVNSGSVVDIGTQIFTGAGTFDVLSGGGINIGSVDGITASSAQGNVQVTGTRTYDSGGFYTYNGTAAQVTGDGLPTQVSKLKIDNANHVTLTNSVSIQDTLIFINGDIITNADTVTIGISKTVRGAVSRTNGQVVGNLKRWFNNTTSSNIEFPIGVGTYYEGINLSYTGAPSAGGTITANYSAVDPGKNGFNLIESGDTITNIGYGLWQTTPGNGLTGGTFSIDITATALPSVADYTKLHLLRRANGAAAWALSGAHAAGTGSNAIPVVHRTGLTSHGQYGIGGSNVNPLPIKLLYFTARQESNIVKFSWATASEINNDYFTVERSDDGENFEEVVRQKGAGTSTFTLYYADKDNNPLKGQNYYRLKQTDFDGQFTYSEVVVVNFEKPDLSADIEIISVAPNPFDEHFNLNFTAKKDMDVNITIINSSGASIVKEQFHATEGGNTYECPQLSSQGSGIYFLTLSYNDLKITRKIIKK